MVFTPALIMELIIGFFKFPGELAKLIRVLESTPQENREKLIAMNQAWGKSFEETGRPPEWK